MGGDEAPLAEEAIEKLHEKMNPERYLNIYEAAEMLGVRAGTLAFMRSRCSIKGYNIDVVLHFGPKQIERHRRRRKQTLVK